VARAHSENAFGNPEDLQEYIRKLEEPERDVWQKTSEVLRVLELRPDHVVGEIGAGSGYEDQLRDLALRGTAIGETLRKRCF